MDVSGGFHGKYTDLFDFHCYHNAEEIRGYLQDVARGKLTMDTLYGKSVAREDAVWDGLTATHASEYGGVAYSTDGEVNGLQGFMSCVQEQNAWGYSACMNEDAFVDQYVKTTEQWLACDKICGFCYTQLYDIEQEQNGLYTYDRLCKLSEKAQKKIAECNKETAAIE